MDREAWNTPVCVVAKEWTLAQRLNNNHDKEKLELLKIFHTPSRLDHEIY